MKESKKQVENSILVVAEKLDILEPIKAVIENNGFENAIKDLLLKSFIDNYSDYFENSDKVYAAIQILRSYSKELRNNGFVKFDNNINI